MSADLTAARAQAFSLPAAPAPVPGERVHLDGVTLRGLALCVECVQAAYYPGEVTSASRDRDAVPMAHLAGYEVSLDTDGDGDTLAPWFTWGGPGSCNGCDTRLGGDRYTASAWRRPVRPALVMRSYPVRDRVAVASWEGTERPGDLGDQVRPAVELHAAHNLSRKAYEVSLYAVTYIERDGYRMTRFTVRPGALVRLASIPAARMSGARLVALRDEWAGHLSRALEGEAGPVSPEAVAWVREVTA